MTRKSVLAMLTAGTMAVGSFSFTCMAGEEEEQASPSIEVSEYYFGVLNVPYADFYYGEINHIQPEALEDGMEGKYEAEDMAGLEGYREDGIYDAVTSATNAKSTRFAKTYYEENGDGANIIGPSGVHVAISKVLYENVQQAIKNGTECANPLIDLVSSLGEVTEDIPAEYKVINSDGTLSETIGVTVPAENVTAEFASNSVWGNYQLSFEGLELDAATIQGALLETSDGKIYGLEHLDNLWLQPNEVAFAVTEMTEPHGNTPSYQRFEDIQGKTITKMTYMIADSDDISIDLDFYCKELLPEDASLYSMSDGVITLSPELKPGQYSLVLSDETYADQKLTCMVESGLNEEDVSIVENRLTVADNESGLTASDYISALSSVSVNGEAVNGRDFGAVIFQEDGSVNTDAALDVDGEQVPVFDEAGFCEIRLEATGYPAVTGTVTLD
ncbi:hemoblobin-interacting domain-containing protein [Blautia sp. HCP3S3_G3]|uniref:hemoblobin-interacting domain-containing protein n=1 Tax=Blautia sp. HCP3S3_G3 TaxID=3438913 RepID=UPI003F8A2705